VETRIETGRRLLLDHAVNVYSALGISLIHHLQYSSGVSEPLSRLFIERVLDSSASPCHDDYLHGDLRAADAGQLAWI